MPSGVREEQKRATRARIVETARQLFVEQGYDSSTIRKIAAAADVSVGTAHSHFRDKAALLHACLEDDLGRTIERAWDTLPEASVVDQLRHLARELYANYLEHPDLSRAMLRESLFPGPEVPPPHFQEFLARVARLIAEQLGIADENEQSAHALAHLFFAAYFLQLVGGLNLQQSTPSEPHELASMWADALVLQLEASGAFSK